MRMRRTLETIHLLNNNRSQTILIIVNHQSSKQARITCIKKGKVHNNHQYKWYSRRNYLIKHNS